MSANQRAGNASIYSTSFRVDVHESMKIDQAQEIRITK